MKIVTPSLLLSLVLMVSCNTKTTKSKSCTFNDQPVECSALEAESFKPLSISASVVTQIYLDAQNIETLENTEDVARKYKNGKEYECIANTHAGENFSHRLDGNKLYLKKHNQEFVFNRIGGEGTNIQGAWKRVEKDKTGSSTLTITFTDATMKVDVTCSFDKRGY